MHTVAAIAGSCTEVDRPTSGSWQRRGGVGVTDGQRVQTGRSLRIGVVGFGNRGIIAHRALDTDEARRHGDQVVAVADPGPAAQQRGQELFGADIAVGDSVSTVIGAGVDAAIVTSPDDAHCEQVVALLEAGIAVFCDKPMAITTAEADLILTTAHRTGSKLYVGHNMRHMPVIRLMKEIIDSGRIGEVKAVWVRHLIGEGGDRFFRDWHADRRRVNSLLLQKGSHDLDIIHWLAGGYTSRVSAMGGLTVYGDIEGRDDHAGQRVTDWISDQNWPPTELPDVNPVVDVEDLQQVNLALDNGVYATYAECHFTPDDWRNYTVIGTRGRLENVGMEGQVRVWDRRKAFNERGDEEIPVPAAQGGHHGADPTMLAEFLAFVRTGVPTLTNPVAARYAVAAGDFATQSLRTGGSALPIPTLDPNLRAYFEAGQDRHGRIQ
ncbi:oxidoreductase [Parenemella sanctibonifatiensis]|uniref:Oxidoreductase n=1 Tax=Parenemella sanctibonifatiensis TaxID=2016505 RepID=A0A255EAP4_9ACTN|nr:oxidoreductase [Parenemella sanctibonifatiensis]